MPDRCRRPAASRRGEGQCQHRIDRWPFRLIVEGWRQLFSTDRANEGPAVGGPPDGSDVFSTAEEQAIAVDCSECCGSGRRGETTARQAVAATTHHDPALGIKAAQLAAIRAEGHRQKRLLGGFEAFIQLSTTGLGVGQRLLRGGELCLPLRQRLVGACHLIGGEIVIATSGREHRLCCLRRLGGRRLGLLLLVDLLGSLLNPRFGSLHL